MRDYIIRKLLVVLIFTIPIVSYTGCKKQARCGCDKDVLFSYEKSLTDDTRQLIDYNKLIFNEEGTTAYFSLGYSSYYFCNPVEMFAKYKSFSSGGQIYISGDVFWECNYLYSSSNYSYQSYYKVYNIHVTALEVQLYGK